MTSQGTSHNYAAVLATPPFFAIEGVDPASPISRQAERIDQLITLLLQDIDANFARVHQTITTHILPEIKRFALASEPTRKSAEFWYTFFTSAAGTSRISLPGDEESGEMTMSTAEPSQYEDTMTGVEGSFMSAFEPGVSSTPLPRARRDRDPSWDGSDVESPFLRVDQMLAQSMHEDSDSHLSTPSVVTNYSRRMTELGLDASSDTVSTPEIPQFLQARAAAGASIGGLDASSASHMSIPDELKTYGARSLYAQSELGRSLEPSRASSTTVQRSTASMLLGEASSSRPGDETEYADSDAGDTPRAQHLQVGTPRRARASTHLIDLTNTPFNMAKYSRPAEREGDRRGAAPVPVRDLLEDSADDFTRLPQASIKFTLPPRADAIYREARAKTPARGRDEDETTKKLSDLLADITSSFSPSPGPIPAELRRYSIMPSDLGPGRKLFDTSAADASRASKSGASPAGSAGNSSTNIFAPTKDNVFASDTTAEYETLTQKYTVASTSAAFDPSSPFNAGPSQQPRHSVADTSFGSDDTTTVPRHMVVADDSDDSFDDDTMQDLRGPAAQDAVAAAAGFAFDDSYMSDDESFIAQQGQGQGRGEYTDTMVGGGERTTEVFGRPGGGRGQFALHQQDEMLTYHGGRLEDAQQPATPLGGGSADISSLGQHHY